MNSALDPLLYNLPKTLEAEEESLRPSAAVVGADASAATAPDEKAAAPEPAAPAAPPNMLVRFLQPHIYSDYATLRALVPHDFVDADALYSAAVERDAYFPPSVRSATPLLWIPRDVMGVSRQEIAHTGKVIPITDEGAELDAEGRVVWTAESEEGARPPIWEEKTYY